MADKEWEYVKKNAVGTKVYKCEGCTHVKMVQSRDASSLRSPIHLQQVNSTSIAMTQSYSLPSIVSHQERYTKDINQSVIISCIPALLHVLLTMVRSGFIPSSIMRSITSLASLYFPLSAQASMQEVNTI